MNRIQRIIAMISLVALVVGLGGALATAQAQGEDTPYARLRWVNASVDAPALDAYVDGRLWIAGLEGALGYSDLDPGEHVVSFRAPGSEDDLASLDLTAVAGQRVTLAALNLQAALDILALTDDVSAPARNASRVRVIHAGPDAGPLAVSMGAKSLASELAYGEVSAARQFFDGAYDVTVTDADGQPLITERARIIPGGRTITLFVAPDEAGAWRIVEAESGVFAPPITSQIRFAHMAADVGPVTVYVNNEAVPLYPDVPFSRVTHYYITGPGDHRFDVYRFGEGPGKGVPLATTTAPVGENESVVFVAYGTGGEVALEAVAGDLSPLPGGTTRLQVIHAAVGSPALAVERIEGAMLAEQVPFLGAVSRVIPAGTYNVRFNDAVTDALLMEKNDIVLPAGTLTVLVAFDDDPAEPLINAVEFSTDYVQEESAVRWANVHTDLGPVDVYLGGEPVALGLEPGTATEYGLQIPRAATMAVFAAGADPATVSPLITRRLELGWSGLARTVYIFGSGASVLVEIAPDEWTLVPGDQGQVRFIQAASGAGTVAVRDALDGDTTIRQLDYGRASVWVPVAAGAHAYRFVLPGEVLTPAQAVMVRAGGMYTVILSGDRSDGLTMLVLPFEP